MRTIIVMIALAAVLIWSVGIPLWEDYALSPTEKAQRATLAVLERPIDLSLSGPAPLEDVLKAIKDQTAGRRWLASGVAIFVDPVALQDGGATLTTEIGPVAKDVPLKTSLGQILKPLSLAYVVKDGLLIISSEDEIRQAEGEPASTTAPPARR
jgi:hypothetical protein